MAIESKETLKQYFETGDYPTQQQFANLIESLRHVNDKIDFADLSTNVVNAINSAAQNNTVIVVPVGETTIQIVAGTLVEKILVIEATAIEFSLGLTPGGAEWLEPIGLDAGGGIISTDKYFAADTDIYFGGITANTILKIYKR
jgi:hypothetical protein